MGMVVIVVKWPKYIYHNATYQVPRSSVFWFWRRLRPSWSCDQDHLDKLLFPCPYEFEFNLPNGFRDVWNCWWTDGCRNDWYTISSPKSLRLRWAKKGARSSTRYPHFFFTFLINLNINKLPCFTYLQSSEWAETNTQLEASIFLKQREEVYSPEPCNRVPSPQTGKAM